MKDLNFENIVKYYGCYFSKKSDLWVLLVFVFRLTYKIVMEYCSAGSCADIMRICKKTFTEAQIAAVCKDALRVSSELWHNVMIII